MLKIKLNLLCLGMVFFVFGVSFADDLNIYSGGSAYTQEDKIIFFEKGLNNIYFNNVPKTIVKNSVVVSGLSEESKLDSVYLGTGYVKNKLLKSYVGESITLLTPDGEKVAKLINASDPLIVELNGKVLLNPAYPIAFPVQDDYQKMISPLTVKILSRKNIKGHFSLKYVFHGLSWSTVYKLSYDEKTGLSSLVSDIIISNSTSKDILSTKPVLIDTAVNGAGYHRKAAQYDALEIDVSTNPADMLKVALTSPIDILAYQDVIYSWKKLTSIKTSKKYEVEFNDYQNNAKKNASIVLTMQKSSINMPKGKMMVFDKKSGDLAGELYVSAMLKGDKPEVKYGSVFDLVAEKKQIKYRKINNKTFEAKYRITIKNKSQQKRRVVVRENIQGQWIIDSSNLDYKKNGSTQFYFDLVLDPNKTKIIDYSLSVTR